MSKKKSGNIGVLLDSLQLPFREGLEKAVDLGVDGIQFYATGEMAPEVLSRELRLTIRNDLEKRGVTVCALCGDLGGHGFEILDEHPWRIEKTKLIIDLASELNTSVVTSHIGVIRESDCETNENIRKALKDVVNYAEVHDVFFAVETGPETAEVLGQFIEDLDLPNLKVNLDPANLLMVQGESPVVSVERLKDHIIHTHAKDGKQVAPSEPVEIYNAFAEGNPKGIRFEDYFVELPLGDGEVDFPSYIEALKNIGYEGYYTIEREAGNDRSGDIRRGVEFLRKNL